MGDARCYRLNVYVASKFIFENLIPDMMVLWGRASERRLGPEGGALLNGISAFIKEAGGNSLSSSAKWWHSKNVPETSTLPDAESA